MQDCRPGEGGIYPEWITTCWLLIISSLSDELIQQVRHVNRGAIPEILKEIQNAMCLDLTYDEQTLMQELFSATMPNTGNDLQSFIAYIKSKRDKVRYLEKEVKEADLVHIFIRGLHPVFAPLQVYYATPVGRPKTLDEAIAVDRNFACTPAVSVELGKLKAPGLSQSVFSVTDQDTPICKNFSLKGSCRFGADCKFKHISHPAGESERNSRLTCEFCKKIGHTASRCWKRKKQELRPPNSTGTAANQSALIIDEDDVANASARGHEPFSIAAAVTSSSKMQDTPFSLMMVHIALSHHKQLSSAWILDSGATVCATYDAKDCVDIEDCNVQVTAGASFTVLKRGKAVIDALSSTGKNCLISAQFPYRLLSLQSFTSRGHRITMEENTVHITNKVNNVTLVASKDPESRLYLLRTSTPQTGTAAQPVDINHPQTRRRQERYVNLFLSPRHTLDQPITALLI